MTEQLIEMMTKAEGKAKDFFAPIDNTAFINTQKVLKAFQKHRVSDASFNGSTGYGYDDLGRETIEKIYADVFGAQAALVRQGFVNGTHAIGCAMFSCVKMGDVFLSATGSVYDTLQTVTGQRGAVGGTFMDYGIEYRQVELSNGRPDLPAIVAAAADPRVRGVFIQRSRGYGDRVTLSCLEIGEIVASVKAVNPGAAVIVDNCYGEFCEATEPTQHGADLVCGSLIKNPGGGLALTGGYIIGRADLVERGAYRMTVPGIGGECGATLGQNRNVLQGLFMAPHIVGQALKTAVFAAAILEDMGYQVSPRYLDTRQDIIQTVRFNSPEPLLAFCRGIQAGSPVDSFATPEASYMPGYESQVVMAAGAFVQGSSIELSCDGPMREPYIGYLQGGLTYEAGKLGILSAVEQIIGIQK